MALEKGSLSLCRYRLNGTSDLKLKAINQHLIKHQAGELNLSGEAKELKAGWVIPSQLLAPDDERVGSYWDLSDCRVDSGYLLKLRIERRSVPQEFFQLSFKQAVAEQKRSKKIEKLSRQASQDLREELKETLLKQALPVISYVEAYWHDSGWLYLFTQAKTKRELFEDFFTKTFAKPMGLSLLRVDPPLLALSQQSWKHLDSAAPLVAKMEKLIPTALNFHY